MTTLLPGTRVRARGLAWDAVHVEQAGDEHHVRGLCSEGALRARESDRLAPFEADYPVAVGHEPAKTGRLRDWRLYHDPFLLQGILGPRALPAAALHPNFQRLIQEGVAVQRGERRGTRYRRSRDA